jgi:hypothetical protein
MEYIQLVANKDLPEISQFSPFKAVLAVEDSVAPARQTEISDWLVGMGGKYVMICGEDSQSWADSIRQANLKLVNIDDMQAEEFVMITVHHQERLRNVFWHARKHARHTHVEIKHILVIHIGQQNRSIEYLSMFDKA